MSSCLHFSSRCYICCTKVLNSVCNPWWRVGKEWLVTYLMLLPHIQALFRTSLQYRLLGTKQQHLQSQSHLHVFQTVISNKQEQKLSEKPLCVFLPFLLVGLTMLLFPITFKQTVEWSSRNITYHTHTQDSHPCPHKPLEHILLGKHTYHVYKFTFKVQPHF